MHVSSWTIGIILFFVSYLLLRLGKPKGQKITHMILRVFYILIVISGGTLVGMVTAKWGFPDVYALKTILGLLVITMMELILVKTKKGVKASFYWFLFLIFLILVFFYGYGVLNYL